VLSSLRRGRRPKSLPWSLSHADAVDELAPSIDLGRHVGERELHSLPELRDRPPELLAPPSLCGRRGRGHHARADANSRNGERPPSRISMTA